MQNGKRGRRVKHHQPEIRVEQMQLGHQDVERQKQHRGGEHLRREDRHHQRLAADELEAAERVAADRRQRHAGERHHVATNSEFPSQRRNGCSVNKCDVVVRASNRRGMIARSVDRSRFPGRSEIDSTLSAG